MRQKSLKALLDPVRLAILYRLSLGPATTAGVRPAVPGASRATVYRALEQLRDAGLIRVTETRQVRGAQERTWALAVEAEALEGVEPPIEQLVEAVSAVFGAFVALPASRLADEGSAEEVKTWVRARSAQIHVRARELAALRESLQRLLAPYLKPRPGARALHLTTFLVPAPDA